MGFEVGDGVGVTRVRVSFRGRFRVELGSEFEWELESELKLELGVRGSRFEVPGSSSSSR